MVDAAQRDTVFIFYSALRSGSTLLHLMLDSHPDISSPGERDFMVDHIHRKDGRLWFDRDALDQSRIFHASGLAIPDTTDGAEAFWDFVAQEQARAPGKVLLVELHRRLDILQELFPEARFVRLVRDPRDVARSSIKLGWGGNTWSAIDHWIDTERGWDAGAVPDSDVCALRYEDLLADPETQLTRICDFVGVSYSDKMLGYADHSTYAPVNPDLAFQWTRSQSVDEVSDVEHKVGDLLVSRGYAHSQTGPRAPSALRKLMLKIVNKAFVWRYRIRRFGLRDPLLVAVAHKTGRRDLGRAAQLRINEKIRQGLK